jgi:hypothetical protein
MTFALQHGDRTGVDRALSMLSKSARELQHAELIWHSDRVRVVDRMNRGELRDAGQLLRELRSRAKALQLFAHELVCGNDFLVLLRQTVDLHEPSVSLSSLAQPAAHDTPGVLALKLRAAVDMHRPDVAQVIFADFVQRDFERLPCDRDYLGVTCHLAYAALLLEDEARVRSLYTLLAPHAAMFTSDISFHTDGSIAHVLGLLARYLCRRDEALGHLRTAVQSNERMSLRARAAESRFELARTLQKGAADERCASHDLLLSAVNEARTLGMAPLLARASALLTP